MKFARRAAHDGQVLFDITSMIDVVFLLIIFFMVTARYAQEARADIDLPKEQGAQLKTPDEVGLVINIEKSGRLIINGQEVDMATMSNIVRDAIQREPNQDARSTKLTLRADRHADTARLNEVVNRLQKLGVGIARVATEVPR